MNRTEKQPEIEELKGRFAKAQIAIVTDYKGLTVEAFNMLRRKLKEKNSDIKVIKNRLAKIAIKGTSQESLSEHLVGTTAVATSNTDPVAPAKVLVDFAKDNDIIKFKIANLNGHLLNFKQVEALAKLPSREELIAKLLGSMQAPARAWVTVLSQIPRQVVNVLAAIRDKKEKGE
jgi:large subunit ribosomal protein L10